MSPCVYPLNLPLLFLRLLPKKVLLVLTSVWAGLGGRSASNSSRDDPGSSRWKLRCIIHRDRNFSMFVFFRRLTNRSQSDGKDILTCVSANENTLFSKSNINQNFVSNYLCIHYVHKVSGFPQARLSDS